MGAVSENVLRLVLAGLHSTLRLRQWICVTFEWFWINLLYYTSAKHKGTNLESIVGDAKLLVKLPKHLALLVQQESASCDDLARLVIWAFASGIKTVSLYDSHGKLMEQRALLQSRLSYHHHQIFSPPMPDLKVCTSQELQSFSPHSSSSLLHQDTEPYQLVLLSPQDGRQRLVEVAVCMCEAVLGGREGLEQMNTDTLATKITGKVGVAEPEVALIFGSTCSTMGYPPWHLRLSEIHWLASHHKVRYRDFHQVLQAYTSCKQRLGK